MAMTADEWQRLSLIERALREDDPGLDSRLGRMAIVSREATSVAIGALAMLLVAAAALLTVGAVLVQPACLIVGVLVVTATPVGVAAWRLWVSRYRVAPADTRPFQRPPLPR